jgi:exo-beta-1,3-glucanase (GH17 family)
MNRKLSLIAILITITTLMSCKEDSKSDTISNQETTPMVKNTKDRTAAEILGNTDFQAISYGGYRGKARTEQPTVAMLKEDMRLLHAMGIRILRTYNVQLDHASNVLKAIDEIKQEDPSFEMYVMLGAWIDCLNAWTDKAPDHNVESPDNTNEIDRAVALANKYPDIVKVIAVGNEAMVKWAATYYVQPNVILKWVNHLQDLKKNGKLDKDLWITCSDNFASWGGGDPVYHVEDLNQLIHAVDYLSIHTYPMHDTHYNPVFWKVLPSESPLTKKEQLHAAMLRAKGYAISQYDSVKAYMHGLGVEKPIHIGETGWASFSNELYGPEGSKANDEYKEALFYNHMRDWTNEAGMSCFYFEAFDEQWKDAANPQGSENYFGLFTLDGKAKYVLWDEVDKGTFKGLGRNGKPVTKTFNGDKEILMKTVLTPVVKR